METLPYDEILSTTTTILTDTLIDTRIIRSTTTTMKLTTPMPSPSPPRSLTPFKWPEIKTTITSISDSRLPTVPPYEPSLIIISTTTYTMVDTSILVYSPVQCSYVVLSDEETVNPHPMKLHISVFSCPFFQWK